MACWDRVEEMLLEQCKTNCTPICPIQKILAPLALFYKGGNWKKNVKLLSHVELFAIPWVVACWVALAMAFFQARILIWVVIPSSRGSFWLISEAQRETPTVTRKIVNNNKTWPLLKAFYRFQKDLNDPDNYKGVITHLEQDILKFELKWVLGSITMRKASGVMEFRLCQILKVDVVKVLYSIHQQIWKSQQ